MGFKEDVEFYLNQDRFNYYGFDIANDSIAEEEDGAEEGGETSEASVKTKKKKCPECGKDPCECKASKKTKTPDEEDDNDSSKCSMKTGTHGEEDDDGWHASAGTPPADFGSTPEEIEMIKLIKKNGGLGGKFVPETPEEKEMLKLAAKLVAKSKSKASVKNDHTAGFAPSCGTEKKNLKEEILKNL